MRVGGPSGPLTRSYILAGDACVLRMAVVRGAYGIPARSGLVGLQPERTTRSYPNLSTEEIPSKHTPPTHMSIHGPGRRSFTFLSPCLSVILAVPALTGARPREVLDLRGADVDLRTRVIRIRSNE